MEPDDSFDMYLAALCSIPQLGPVSIRRLIKTFGSAKAVFGAKLNDLASVDIVGPKKAEAVKSYDEFDDLAYKIDDLEDRGIKAVFDTSPLYPQSLKSLGDDAPAMLYIKGAVTEADKFAVAIVGSRSASPYGRIATERISTDLASMGITIVSGLARGIDTAAQKCCLESGGRSIGVMGCGMDLIYPPENKWLYDACEKSGAVISEFPPDAPPLKINFPRRNRLISGLALGVLVVEAAPSSGSLITAKHALEQGKEVFSVPGSITSELSDGTNKLIKDGAKIVTSADDIIEELAPMLKGFIKSINRKANAPVELDDEERAVCDIMTPEPAHIDAISRNCGMAAAKTLALLCGLELKGVVRQIEGKRFYLS